MDVAEKRRANRARVAAGFGDPDPTPGLSGAEVAELARLNPHGGARRDQLGHTQFKGGWRSSSRLAYGKGRK